MIEKRDLVGSKTLTLATVLKLPESSLDDFFDLLESIPDARLIFRKTAVYDLYITAVPPEGAK